MTLELHQNDKESEDKQIVEKLDKHTHSPAHTPIHPHTHPFIHTHTPTPLHTRRNTHTHTCFIQVTSTGKNFLCIVQLRNIAFAMNCKKRTSLPLNRHLVLFEIIRQWAIYFVGSEPRTADLLVISLSRFLINKSICLKTAKQTFQYNLNDLPSIHRQNFSFINFHWSS